LDERNRFDLIQGRFLTPENQDAIEPRQMRCGIVRSKRKLQLGETVAWHWFQGRRYHGMLVWTILHAAPILNRHRQKCA
jgi:hypothetical protein